MNILLVIIRITVNNQNISVYKGYLSIYVPSHFPRLYWRQCAINRTVRINFSHVI